MATPIPRAETPSDDDESDATDTISLTDTVHSDWGENQVWELENILAETEFDELDDDGNISTVTQYLLKWKGYSVYRSTWETADHLVDGVPETWRAWQESKMRIARNFMAPFDIEAWEDKQVMRYDKRIRRHERRNKKRRRMGLPIVNYNDDREDSAEATDDPLNGGEHVMADSAEDSSDDEPPVKRVRMSTMQDISDDDRIRASSTKRKRRTVEQIEREREHTRALLKRKKGIAIPRNKNQATVKSSSDRSSFLKSAVEATTLVTEPLTSTGKLARGVTRPSLTSIKTVPSTPNLQSLSGRLQSTEAVVPEPSNGASDMSISSQVAQPTSTTSSSARLQPAPVARMVGGPSRIFKKPVPMIGRAAAGTTNIFANINKPVQRRSRGIDTGLYKNISHRYKAQKAAQQENIPVMDDFDLWDLTTGMSMMRKRKISRLDSEVTNFHQPHLMESTSGSTAAIGSLVDKDENFRTMYASSNAPTLKDRTPLEQPDAYGHLSCIDASKGGNYTKPCYWFATKGLCKWGSGCPFPHVDTDGPTMSPREMKAQITCRFWYISECNKSEETCLYSHAEKAFISPATMKDPPTRLESSTTNKPMTQHELVVTDRSLLRELPLVLAESTSGPSEQNKQMTCYFWFFEECVHPARSCRFAHHLCKYIAGRPPSHQPILTASVSAPPRSPNNMHTAGESTRTANATSATVYPLSKSLSHSTPRNIVPHDPVSHERASLPSTGNEASMPQSSRSHMSSPVEIQTLEQLPLGSSSYSYALGSALTLQSFVPTNFPSSGLTTDNPTVVNTLPNISMPTSLSRDINDQNQAFTVSYHAPLHNNNANKDSGNASINEATGKLATTIFLHSAHKPDPELECDVVLIGMIPTCMTDMASTSTASSCKLDFHHICTAESISTIFSSRQLLLSGQGDVVAAEGSVDQLDALSDHLKIHAAGALCCLPDVNIIFFPVKQNTWKAFQPKAVHPEARLHFRVVPPTTLSLAPDAVLPIQTRDIPFSIWKDALNLDVGRIFAWTSGESVDKAVFLMFPLQNQDDTKFVRAYLQIVGAKVYRSSDSGSWYRFTSEHRTGGVVIFHPDFHAFGQIPFLVSKMLKLGRFNFFQIMLEQSRKFKHQRQEWSPNTTFTLKRLLPHGRAVLISDACFSGNPGDTLAVVKAIVHRIKTSHTTSTKLLGRPDLLRWLHDLALNARNHECDSLFSFEDNTTIEMYNMLTEIVQGDASNFEPLPAAPRLTHRCPVYFLPERDMPGYSNMAKENPQDADNLLAAWFAGWALSHIGEFRRFFIVQPGDMVKQWSEKYKHIEVVTPHQYLQDARSQEEIKVNGSKSK